MQLLSLLDVSFPTRTLRSLLVGFLIFCAHSAHAAYTVYEAAQAGFLKISGYASSGYVEATFFIENPSSTTVDVDFSSVCFVQSNSSQRIGLAYEKSTGAYLLRLPGGYSNTLRFVSRCLDHDRPAPTTGTHFSSYTVISPTRFAPILKALRHNYTQNNVWKITDSSTLLSKDWKDSDPRGPVGGGNHDSLGSNGLDLSGTVSWVRSGSRINIKAERVANNSATRISGTLRLRIWATSSPYVGGSIRGYVLGTRRLGELEPDYEFRNIKGFVAFRRPPRGYFYTTMTLEEYSSSGWVIQDYISFSGRKKF